MNDKSKPGFLPLMVFGTYYAITMAFLIKQYPVINILGQEVDIGVLVIPLTILITGIYVYWYTKKKQQD